MRLIILSLVIIISLNYTLSGQTIISSAYYGSRMNLFRAIFNDSVAHENFKIIECNIDSITGEFTIIKPLVISDLSLSKRILYSNKI
jgi:hypothetical protein